jgi:tetratricopeptide (TPR) repeat protein
MTPFAIKVWRNQSHASRGFAALKDEDYDRAIKEFTQASNVGPRMPNAYVGRGYAWLCKHDYAAAITNFSEAIHSDPNYAEAYYKRGIAHFNSGKPESAVEQHEPYRDTTFSL